MTEVELLDMAEAALLAYCRRHVPWTDNEGRTCDERGCAICNPGPEQAAEDWFRGWMSGDLELPFDPKDEAEMTDFLLED